MVRTRDPMLEVFRKRDDAKVREAYMVQMAKESEEHRAARVGDDGEPKQKAKKKAKAK